MIRKIERLKALVFQLIGENTFLNSRLQDKINCPNKSLSINIKSGSSSYWPSTNTIFLGISDMIDCFNIMKGIKFESECRFSIIDKYLDFYYIRNRVKDVMVNLPTESECKDIEEQLTPLKFFEGNGTTTSEVLAFFSLAYFLYHEIGHFLFDELEPDFLKREENADAFAFKSIKSMCALEDEDVLLLGTFVGVVHVLCKLTYELEQEDKKHPYTVERLYNLFAIWKLKDDSCFWNLACNTIKKWCIKNGLPTEWDSNDEVTYKERFIKAYFLFRRIQ